jgi:hypothetical protein
MPTFLIVMKVNAARDSRFGFKSSDVGEQKFSSANIDIFCEGQKAWQNWSGGMAAQRVTTIVEVKDVRGSAVDERGIETIGSTITAEHRRATTRLANTQGPLYDPCRFLSSAGKSNPQRIQYRIFRRNYRLFG